MSKTLHLLVRSADDLIESLPDVGLSGVRMPDDVGGQVVKVLPMAGRVSTEFDDPEDMWFELSWYADRLGIINGRVVEEDD